MADETLFILAGALLVSCGALAVTWLAGVLWERRRRDRIDRDLADWRARTGCTITGSALIEEADGDLRWHMADPAIHVTTELLDQLDQRGRDFLDRTYKVGDACPYYPGTRHATRRTNYPIIEEDHRG